MLKNIEGRDLDAFSHETSSQRILLEEYRMLQSRYLNLQDEGVTRLNFFITAASISIGSVVVFGGGNSNFPVLYFKIALLAILAILGSLDFYICKFFVYRDVLLDRYERGLARIRRYFLKADPALKDYFITRVFDTPTGNIVNNKSGMRRAAELIEGLLLGLGCAILATFSPLRPEIDIVIGFAAGILVFVFLEFTAQRKYTQAKEDAENEMKFKEKVNAK